MPEIDWRESTMFSMRGFVGQAEVFHAHRPMLFTEWTLRVGINGVVEEVPIRGNRDQVDWMARRKLAEAMS